MAQPPPEIQVTINIDKAVYDELNKVASKILYEPSVEGMIREIIDNWYEKEKEQEQNG